MHARGIAVVRGCLMAAAVASVLSLPRDAAAQTRPAADPKPPDPGSQPAARPPDAKSQPAPGSVDERYAHDGRRTMHDLPLNVLGGMIGVWHPDNLTPVMIGSLAAASTFYIDRNVQRALSNPSNGFGRFAETGGGPIISTSVVAALFLSGRLDTTHKRWRAATYDMLDAAFANLAYTEAVKRIVHRERPNGEDRKSFPSGHASNAFALATCFERHYGWRVSVPAYLIASAVAASRLQRNKHYLSDVSAGAALGYVIGRTVARVNGRPLHPEEKPGAPIIRVSPLLGPGTAGIRVSAVF